jgi:starvation-inducible DNA-binding protein
MSPKFFPTKNNLSGNIREQSVQMLNLRLAQAIDLKLQAKQAHWNVKGPNFIGLHQLFDTIATNLDEAVDLIAERITALAGVAEGTVQAVSANSNLKPYSLAISAGFDHVEALSSALATFGNDVRDGIDVADEAGDMDTADLLTGISRQADKDLWMLESHLIGKS